MDQIGINDGGDQTTIYLNYKWRFFACVVFITHFLYVSLTMENLNLNNSRTTTNLRPVVHEDFPTNDRTIKVSESVNQQISETNTKSNDGENQVKDMTTGTDDVWDKQDAKEIDHKDDELATEQQPSTTPTDASDIELKHGVTSSETTRYEPEPTTTPSTTQQPIETTETLDDLSTVKDTEELLQADFHARFWLKDHSSPGPPWQWFMIDVNNSVNFPFVTNWNSKGKTCLNKPFTAPPDPFKDFYDPEVRKSANVHYTTCQLPTQVQCPVQDIQIPMFQFTSKRRPFTLGDVFNQLARKKSVGPLRITFVGDSTMEDIYNWAKCHLSSLTKVRTVPNSAKLLKLPEGDHPRTEARWYRTVSFMIQTSTGEERKLVLVLARVDRILYEPISKVFCENSDLLALNIGLHHQTPASYKLPMKITLEGLRDYCTKSKTILTLISHPAQHFAESDKGEYVGPSRHHCIPHGNKIQTSDWRSTELVERLLPELEMSIIPSPWDTIANNKACYRAIFHPIIRHDDNLFQNGTRNETVTLPKRISTLPASALHYIPFFDTSASLWNWHLARFNIGLGPHPTRFVADCTHLLYVPSFGVPIWDGMFFAAFNDVSSILASSSGAKKVDKCLTIPPVQYWLWTGKGDEQEKEQKARRNVMDTITETWKQVLDKGDNTETAVASFLQFVHDSS
jgi:hypothetical protein